MTKPRKVNNTAPRREMLRALCEATEPLHGQRIAEMTGLTKGTVNPNLVLFEQQGWVVSVNESDLYPSPPMRTNHRITQAGRDHYTKIQEEFMTGRSKSRPMVITVKLLVTLEDPKQWIKTFGAKDRVAIRQDVKEYLLNAVQGTGVFGSGEVAGEIVLKRR